MKLLSDIYKGVRLIEQYKTIELAPFEQKLINKINRLQCICNNHISIDNPEPWHFLAMEHYRQTKSLLGLSVASRFANTPA